MVRDRGLSVYHRPHHCERGDSMTLASEYNQIFSIKKPGGWFEIFKCNKCKCLVLKEDRRDHRTIMHPSRVHIENDPPTLEIGEPLEPKQEVRKERPLRFTFDQLSPEDQVSVSIMANAIGWEMFKNDGRTIHNSESGDRIFVTPEETERCKNAAIRAMTDLGKWD